MRPTDLATRLNRLADQAGSNQKLRRVRENIDAIAQAAVDHEATYVNKKGDAVTAPAPQWHIALSAQKSAAQLLGLEPNAAPTEGESVIDRMQREIADRTSGRAS